MQLTRLVLITLLSVIIVSGAAEPHIVRDGKANAEIIIAETPPRMVEVAANELQLYVRKITGATLPIVHEVSGEHAVAIYIGESPHTDQLGVTAEGLKYGAYRLVSGPDRLILLGEDYDYEPREPWPRGHTEVPDMEKKWDAITGHTWGLPMVRLYKDYNEEFDIWRFDQGGSLNAVYAFLRSLGVRWYMPGEIGEVVPKQTSIALPDINQTVHPSFALRQLKWGNYAAIDWDDLIWDRRMGINSGYQVWGAQTFKSHGMRPITGRLEMKQAHPDYYALIGGVRDNAEAGKGTPCLRSPGLIQETIAYCRAVFDHYDQPMVSIWPTDGFKPCKCDLCNDIDSTTDYVWQFVEQVARELYKTHPDRKVSSGAYGSYADPPASISQFSPNVAVYIANRGRAWFGQPEHWAAYWSDIQSWQAKVAAGNLMRGENNLLSGRQHPTPFPPLHPREFAKDLQALQGISIGERNEVPRGGSPHTWNFPGVDHLNLYVNARFLWDANQDIEAMLDEYVTLFYGPASREMKVALDFADANFPAPPDPKRLSRWPDDQTRLRFMEHLHTARQAAGDSIYGKRIQLMIDELPPIEEIRVLAQREASGFDPRADAPLLVIGASEASDTYSMKDLVSGDQPEIGTEIAIAWEDKALVVNFHCEEPDMENLYATDWVWDGDAVALLIETPAFRYYHLEISPEGKVFERAINKSLGTGSWSALAEVETTRGDDYWTVRVKLPISGPNGLEMDPNHKIAGAKPTDDAPWFINLCRSRVRDGQKSTYALNPTGKSYHQPEKFARLVIR